MNYNDYKNFIKKSQYDKIVNKYKREVLRQLFDVLLYNKKHSMYPCDREVIPFSVSSARTNMGRSTVDGTKKWNWDIVQKTTPILKELWKGNSKAGYVTAMCVTDWEFIVNSIEEKLQIDEIKKYANEDSNLWDIHIDIPGITCLKQDIMNELKNPRLKDYRKGMLSRQLFWAQALLTYCPEGVLKQFCEPASTGRMYVKGLNLQNCPKRVRSIALGEHYLYDFKACAFSIFVSLYYDIAEMTHCDGSLGTRAMRDYITNRERIRVKIVRDLYYPTDTLTWNKMPIEEIKASKEYKLVKTAFTAMGFGAKPRAGMYPSNNGYTKTALTKIFYSKEATQNFLDHEIVKNIITELQDVTKIILEYYKTAEPTLEVTTGFPYVESETESREAKLAHIYQGHEVKLLKLMIGYAGKSSLLPLHDGLATKTKIPNDKLIEMKLKIKEVYPYVELDKPEHKRSYFKNYEEESRMKEHKSFIQKQERLALTYERGDNSENGININL